MEKERKGRSSFKIFTSLKRFFTINGRRKKIISNTRQFREIARLKKIILSLINFDVTQKIFQEYSAAISWPSNAKIIFSIS